MIKPGDLIPVDREIHTCFPGKIPRRIVHRIDRNPDPCILHGAEVQHRPLDLSVITAAWITAKVLARYERTDEVGNRLLVCIYNDLDPVIQEMTIQADIGRLILLPFQRRIRKVSRQEAAAPNCRSRIEVGVNYTTRTRITRNTPFAAQLEVIQPTDPLHELFLRNYPGR